MKYIVQINKFPDLKLVEVNMTEPTPEEVSQTDGAIALMTHAHEALRKLGYSNYKIEKIFVQVF